MTPSYGRSQEQHDNTQKLIDGLKAKPDDYDLLVMESFGADDIAAKHATPEHPCRTAMCVAGHGPSLGIPFTAADNNSWVNYTIRAFGFMGGTYEWSFCFSPVWSDDMNQAVARLELAQRGEIPLVSYTHLTLPTNREV